MFVGEIGLPRLEYLYELMRWEMVLILRGYHARHHNGWEQARLVAYNAHFCMGSTQPPPIVTKWLPFPWERQQQDEPTDEEIEKIRAQLKAENERIAKAGT